jgi:lysine 2,3-aminomutase
MVVHCNHAQELGKEAVGCLRRLVDSGISVLNQSVLLAGVNDSVSALVDLSNALVDLGIKPYYLHLTDPVPGNAPFRVDATRAIGLHDELKQRVSGIALPALVVDLPDGSGKVDVRQALSTGVLG